MAKQFLGFYNPLVKSYENLLAYARLWSTIKPDIPITRKNVLGMAKEDELALSEKQIQNIIYYGNGKNFKKEAAK